MATYAELASIQNDPQWGDFLNRVRVACAVKAAAVIDSTTPGQAVLDWAKSTISSPNSAGDQIAYYVIAANKTATLNQIYTATDTTIQNNVDAAVDAIYGV